jgi:hypothetical protein
MVPKIWVTTEVGSRLSAFESTSTNWFAGSLRAPTMRSRMPRMRSARSSAEVGSSNRAGTKSFPARSTASAARTLMGMPMRSPGSSTPCSWW